MEEDPKIKSFKDSDQFKLDLFIAAINPLVTMPKASFIDIFKKKNQVKANTHRENLEKLRSEFAEVTREVIQIPSGNSLVKRTVVAELVEDIYALAYAFVNKTASLHVTAMFDGSKSYTEVIAEAKNICLTQPGESIHKIAEVVLKLARDNESLKKDVNKAKESMKTLESKLVEANGVIEQLKSEAEKLGGFKWTNVRNTQIEASASKKRRHSAAASSADDDDVSDVVVHRPPPPAPSQAAASLVEVTSIEEVEEQRGWRTQQANGKRTMDNKNNNSNQNSVRFDKNKDESKNNNKKNSLNNKQPGGYKRIKCLTGTEVDGSSVLTAAIRRFHFFVGRCQPSMTVANIRSHVNDKVGCNILDIAELTDPNDASRFYRNFRVTVEDLDGPKMLDVTKWPRNVQIGRYFFPPKGARGQQPPGGTLIPQKQTSNVNGQTKAIDIQAASSNLSSIASTNNNLDTNNSHDETQME